MAQPELVKDIEARVKKSGDTMTGNLIGKYFQGTWLQTTSITDLGSSPSKIAVIKDDGWIYYRTPSELAKDIGLTNSNYVRSFYETNEYFDSFTSNNLVGINYCGAGTGGEFYIGREWGKNSDGNNFGMQLRFSGWNGQLYTRSFNGWGAQWSDWLTYLNNTNFGNYALPLTGGTLTGRLYIKISGNQILLGDDQYKKTILRNDGSDFWLLVSDVGSNEFNNLRPFRFNLSSGQVYISHGLNITGGTFNYSSIQSGSSNADRNVWFSTSSNRGTPCFNDNFKYNPSTNTLTVGNVKGTISSSYYLKGRTYWESWANNGNYSGVQYLQGQLASSTTPTANKVYLGSSGEYSVISAPTNTYQNGGTNNPCNVMLLRFYWGTTYFREISSSPNNDTIMTRNVKNGSSDPWRRIWQEGESVTGAVWNDYAECREADTIEPGYVLVETGDDSLTKSTERLSPFAGVSSDTWGFSQGETDKAKTPIAVAGRVLVYPWQDRNNYKPGDCVCAAPEGKVDIMTREEIIQYPDRIVGTVSSVPTYDKWGGGEKADREPVDVNGRIWIKIK